MMLVCDSAVLCLVAGATALMPCAPPVQCNIRMMHCSVQTMIRLQDFIGEAGLASDYGRKLQRGVQLGFDLHGGVSLAAALATPEVSRVLREEVLDYAYGPKLRVRAL